MNLRTMIANRPTQKRPAKMTPAVALAVGFASHSERRLEQAAPARNGKNSGLARQAQSQGRLDEQTAVPTCHVRNSICNWASVAQGDAWLGSEMQSSVRVNYRVNGSL